MMKKSLCATLILTAGGLMTIGCSNHDAGRPGPGPTAMPESYQGKPIEPGGPINTERRLGGSGTMQDQAR